MNRYKNLTFKGSGFYECEPNAITNTSTYANIVGDDALNFDLGKGGTSSGVVLNHSGDGDGCLLGYPLINEIKENYLVKPNNLLSGGDDYVVWAAPVIVPAGETTIFVEVKTTNTFGMLVQAFEATGSAVLPSTAVQITDKQEMSFVMDGASFKYNSSLSIGANPSGMDVFIVIEAKGYELTAPFQKYLSFNVHFNRRKESSDGMMNRVSGSGSNYKLLTETLVEADGTAIVNADQPIDEVLVEANQPINGYVVNRMNKEQNALVEYITGAPVASNGALTLQSSAATVPDRSAFYDHSEGGNNGYEIPQIPLGGSGVGSMNSNWTGFEDFPGAMPLGGTAAGAQTNAVWDHICYVPDMLIGGAASRARMRIAIICSIDSAPGCVVTMKAKSFNSSGSASTEESASITVSDVGVYFLDIAVVRCWRDRFNRVRITMQVDANYKVAGSGFLSSICLLGFCLYAQ